MRKRIPYKKKEDSDSEKRHSSERPDRYKKADRTDGKNRFSNDEWKHGKGESRRKQSSDKEFTRNKWKDDRKPSGRSGDSEGGKRPFGDKGYSENRFEKKDRYNSDFRSNKKPGNRGGRDDNYSSDTRKRNFDSDNKERGNKSYGSSRFEKKFESRPKRDRDDDTFIKRDKDFKGHDKKEYKSSRFEKKFESRPKRDRDDDNFEKRDKDFKGHDKKEYKSSRFEKKYESRPKREYSDSRFEKPKRKYDKKSKKKQPDINEDGDGLIRLNKYIANAGICSRREADEYITSGLVSVNGKVVTELGTKVSLNDTVRYNGEAVRKEKFRYVLLNKPKDYITTTDDPGQRHTVMELVAKACRERIYPVGRLDRNTTGLLFFTNDGDLANKLMHPSAEVKKIYQVELDKNLKPADFEKIQSGFDLEDGFIKPDEIAYDAQTESKKIVGITLHSGRNRIVRRIFESLGYEVRKLDRVYYAGLTKKDLQRGRCRHLTEMEINMLRMVPSKKK